MHISGELGLDNIEKLDLMDISEINEKIQLDINSHTAIVTYHPATLELKGLQKKIGNILNVLKKFDLQYVFTYPNTDPGHEIIIKEIKKFVKNHSSSVFIESLGQKLYLNLMKHAKVMIGNSSSGFFEAPSYILLAQILVADKKVDCIQIILLIVAMMKNLYMKQLIRA